MNERLLWAIRHDHGNFLRLYVGDERTDWIVLCHPHECPRPFEIRHDGDPVGGRFNDLHAAMTHCESLYREYEHSL